MCNKLEMRDTKLMTDLLKLQKEEQPKMKNYYQHARVIWDEEYSKVLDARYAKRSISPKF